MAERVTSIEKYGIPLGDPAVQRKVVLGELGKKGVNIHKGTVSRYRMGNTSGEKIGKHLELSERLDGDVRLKDQFYLDLARAGKEVRGQASTRRYAAIDFVNRLAEYLDLDPQDIRRSFRAMRTDVVMAENAGDAPRVIEYLIPIAARYFHDYSKSSASVPLREISREWDQKSVRDFYRCFYETATTTSTMRTFPPYEVELFERFYEERVASGSSPSPLDTLTIAKNLGKLPIADFVATVRSESSVPFDKVVHFTHTNALLYGQPTNPLRTNRNGHRLIG